MLAGVGAVPVADHVRLAVWGVFEGVVLGVPVAGFDPGDFLADADEGIFDAVQLAARLTLSGLDHDGAGDGKLMLSVYGNGMLSALLSGFCFRLFRLKAAVRA